MLAVTIVSNGCTFLERLPDTPRRYREPRSTCLGQGHTRSSQRSLYNSVHLLIYSASIEPCPPALSRPSSRRSPSLAVLRHPRMPNRLRMSLNLQLLRLRLCHPMIPVRYLHLTYTLSLTSLNSGDIGQRFAAARAAHSWPHSSAPNRSTGPRARVWDACEHIWIRWRSRRPAACQSTWLQEQEGGEGGQGGAQGGEPPS